MYLITIAIPLQITQMNNCILLVNELIHLPFDKLSLISYCGQHFFPIQKCFYFQTWMKSDQVHILIIFAFLMLNFFLLFVFGKGFFLFLFFNLFFNICVCIIFYILVIRFFKIRNINLLLLFFFLLL